MLVYGDQSERMDPRARLAEVATALDGRLTHQQLATAFIDLAGLAQGIADADFAEQHEDRVRPAERALLSTLTGLAATLLRSWDDGCTGAADLPSLPDLSDLPAEIEIRLPEGYAFYALTPEAYGLAARQLRLTATPRIIGLRSIGTGLACMAAAALGAPPPVTLRPAGHPFARSLSIAPDLAAQLLEGDPHFVIVDEGPGLSGSSLGAVADWLEDHGVPRERIAFLPGHANPLGPQASERHRARWTSAQKPVVPAADLLRDRLPQWLEPLVGPLDQPLIDISAGGWRPLWSAAEHDWPAVNSTWERMKFLARSRRKTWLVKFAGLGRTGEAKLQLAQRLEATGFGPDVAGLVHGWLVTRWHEEAHPTRPTLDELTRYLGLRASWSAPRRGASPEQLLAMARHNAPAQLGAWSPDLGKVRSRPVLIDGRMDAHEWLRLPSAKLLKADALDHHAAHDLVGCQDIAWDLAGAMAELDLREDDAIALANHFDIDAPTLDFHRRCYLAFRLGAHRMSEGMTGPEERLRHAAAAQRFERLLSALVDGVQHARHIDQPLGFRVEALA